MKESGLEQTRCAFVHVDEYITPLLIRVQVNVLYMPLCFYENRNLTAWLFLNRKYF